MPTYVYETIPASPDRAPRRFEHVQAMQDPPLTHDPETGEPVKRIITGGLGMLKGNSSASLPSSGMGCGKTGCGHSH